MRSTCCAAGSIAPSTTTRVRCPPEGCAEVVAGLLDGLLLDITGCTPDEVDTGVALVTELG